MVHERHLDDSMPAKSASREVSPTRIPELIVQEMCLLIQQGRLTPGDRLPSEQQLCRDFGAGRQSVREALRALEARGLVRVRTGGRGGVFVAEPTREWIGHGDADLLDLSAMTPRQLTDARSVIELSMVRLVCRRADAHDIADLLRICDRIDVLAGGGRRLPLSLSAEFHIRVAAATHNRPLEILARSFYGTVLMSARATAGHAKRVGPPGNLEHRRFVDAVVARDGAAAETIVRQHLVRAAARLV